MVFIFNAHDFEHMNEPRNQMNQKFINEVLLYLLCMCSYDTLVCELVNCSTRSSCSL